jgi:protein-disulfide isomerase
MYFLSKFFMKCPLNNDPLTQIFVSVFVSVALSLSGVYFLFEKNTNSQISDTEFEQKVEAGIMKFIAKQEQDQQKQMEEQNKQVEEKASLARVPSSEYDYFKGKEDAKITIIEYSDYECPYCKRHHSTLQEVLAKYENDVNWVYRHFPLEFHNPNATDQAVAAECVGKISGAEAFWKFSDEVYARTESNLGFPKENILPLAKEIGVDEAMFSACFDAQETLSLVEEDIAEVQAMGVQGAPANFIRNNETGEMAFIGGAYPLSEFEKKIDAFLQ